MAHWPGDLTALVRPIGIIFEDGGFVELSYGMVTPSVSGVALPIFGGADSGSVAPAYSQLSLGVKQQINDMLSIALVLDHPYGASVSYPLGTGYPLAGTTAEVSSEAITAIGRYKLNDRFSVHGGVRVQSISGDIFIVPAYTLTMDASGDVGYLVGAAFEIPDIALRVAVTYNSEVATTLSGTEFITGPLTLDVILPQSINLDFQTGIAADTLLFGSVRWAEWTAFDLMPPIYALLNSGDSLLDYSNDVTTYTIGVGRKFSDEFSGSIAVGYEAATATPATPSSNLSPTDGFISVQIGGKYTMGNMAVSGGIRYVQVGDATTNTLLSSFTDNSAIGVGVKVGYSF